MNIALAAAIAVAFLLVASHIGERYGMVALVVAVLAASVATSIL